jgi:hypothetical protein
LDRLTFPDTIGGRVNPAAVGKTAYAGLKLKVIEEEFKRWLFELSLLINREKRSNGLI